MEIQSSRLRGASAPRGGCGRYNYCVPLGDERVHVHGVDDHLGVGSGGVVEDFADDGHEGDVALAPIFATLWDDAVEQVDEVLTEGELVVEVLAGKADDLLVEGNHVGDFDAVTLSGLVDGGLQDFAVGQLDAHEHLLVE